MSIVEKFIPPYPLNTPVLFLVFNRLDNTKQVFEATRQAKPPKLYVASDGARKSKGGEAEKVQKVRDYIMSSIDWDCEVKTLFRDENLGCKIAPSDAITWFFKNEEMGIILEDDCLPSQSFFWFCEELLDRYKDNKKIAQISGNNFQNGKQRGNGDYYFSIYNHIWGWASWADRWIDYDRELTNFDNVCFIKNIFDDSRIRKYWENIFNLVKSKKLNTCWDYQWTFINWRKQRLTILPRVNLISNIGFGADATHTSQENRLSNMHRYELIINKHPTDIRSDKKADIYTSKVIFLKRNIFVRVIRKIMKIGNKK
ncbi:nucleotide-diphospho-sugar transferase [Francisella opportunistica]|uniref:nucleotide-diphospho-sugar transferase n=1 Tax=Francisella opportunistica TaxID=2016517 RepID=UPI000E0AC5AE|nr:nucleotide-diphospho-sugar transferase [Francisella opportunistica]AXH32933.1 nucleotide-diphospho-sugar transferase [Francisella opportunistica]